MYLTKKIIIVMYFARRKKQVLQEKIKFIIFLWVGIELSILVFKIVTHQSLSLDYVKTCVFCKVGF